MHRPAVPILAQISVVHLVSHVFILAIPSLFPLLPAALDVNFVALGAAMSLFCILSAMVQAPMGFVVDRYGPRKVLLVGMVAGTASFLFLALFPTYTGLLVAAGLAGAANGVYHPSDYAILSRSIEESVMGRAFSIHSFAGFCGSAITPFLLTFLATSYSVSVAFAVTGVIGFFAILIFWESRQEEKIGESPAQTVTPTDARSKVTVGVFTIPVLVLTVLYVLLSLGTTSFERFSTSALIQGYGVSLSLANSALTAFLVCTAVGVLSGGILADRTHRHGFVAASGFGLAAILAAIVALTELSAIPLVIIFALIGLLTGLIVPSRDMMVRDASPRGSEGKIFGIVSTGFNIGGMVGPLVCGYFLDHGMPLGVFWFAMIFMVLVVLLTWTQEMRYGKKQR